MRNRLDIYEKSSQYLKGTILGGIHSLFADGNKKQGNKARERRIFGLKKEYFERKFITL